MTAKMTSPPDLRHFHCDDYFDPQWQRGNWDEQSQLMVVVPVGEHVLRAELEFLAIGNAGTDGIEFGYRRGHSGLWACYGITGEFVAVAKSVADLVDGYMSGRIRV